MPPGSLPNEHLLAAGQRHEIGLFCGSTPGISSGSGSARLDLFQKGGLPVPAQAFGWFKVVDARTVCYLGPHGARNTIQAWLDCGVRMKLVRELSWLGPALPAVQLFQCGQCGRADTVELPEKLEAPTSKA